MELEHFESLYPERTRFDEIEKILNFIKEGNSCQVVSAGGVGRSNLLGLLSYNKSVRTAHLGNNQHSFHFVTINFSEIRKRPLSDANKFIFLEILDSLRERGLKKEYDHINKVFKESIEFGDELVLFQGLKKTVDFLCVENKMNLILLFDRFEEYVPMLSSEFFANLRVLRNRAKYQFSIVFSLNRPLEDLLESSLFSDFFEYVAEKIVYLPIEDKVGLNFRISHLEKISGRNIDKKTVDKVLSLTSGHGRLTILALETITSFSNKLPTTNEQLIGYLLTQRPIRSALFSIWNLLNPSEQQFFIDKKMEPIYLEKIFLVNKGKTTIPLFTEFIENEIIKSGKHKELLEADINFDKNTNEIKKGDIIISDQLTSSEFKLLKYLLLNINKIVSKEEIINAVWADKTTTLGVTDQALDQLIFRLRKKIEHNPNSPEHILTLKGRGFKYIN